MSRAPSRLPAHLAQHTVAEVHALAVLHGRRPIVRRAEVEDALLTLMEGTGLRQAVAGLDPSDKRLLAMIAHGDGRLRPSRLRPIGLGMPKPPSRESSWIASPPLTALDLWMDKRGLVSGMAERLRPLLPEPWPERPKTLRPGTDQHVVSKPWDHDAALEALVLERGRFHFTRRGVLDAPSLKRLRGSARGGDRAADDLRWSTLAALVDHCENSSDARSLFDAWARGAAPSDYAGIDLLAAGPYLPELETAPWRRAIRSGLELLPVGAWVPLADLVDWMRQQPLPDLIPASWHHDLCLGVRSGETTLDDLGADGLDWLEQAWIACAIGGALAALGAVEVALGGGPTRPKALDGIEAYPTRYGEGVPLPAALSPGEAVTAFRLTPTGAWLLGRGPRPAAASAGAWRLQGDGTMVSLGERPMGPLHTFANRVGTVLDERSWRLERSLMITALADGLGADELRTRLRELAGGEPPATVTALVEDAVRRHGAVVLGPLLRVLEVADPLAYDQLRHDRATRNLVSDLGPGRIGVDPEQLGTLRTAARKLGWRIP